MAGLLERFKEGAKLSEKQLGEVVEGLIKTTDTKKNAMQKLKANGERVGLEVLEQGVETVSNFGFSLTNGRVGDEKMKLGGKVDFRLIFGLPLELAGLYLTFDGKNMAAAPVLGLGEGALQSLIARAGYNAGEAWRQKAEETKAKAEGANTNPAAPPEDKHGGGVREVHLQPFPAPKLTPATAGRGHRGDRGDRGRDRGGYRRP